MNSKDRGQLLQKKDIPGASFGGRRASALTVVVLRHWLLCRGAPSIGKLGELVNRYYYNWRGDREHPLCYIETKFLWILCCGSCYTLAIDISMSMIDDHNELNRLLENTNMEEFELIGSPREQLNHSLQKNTGVRSASTMVRRGWQPKTGVMRNCALELTLARGPSQ